MRTPMFEHVPLPTVMVLLGVAERTDHNQSHYDKSGDDVLHHGCHSRDPPQTGMMDTGTLRGDGNLGLGFPAGHREHPIPIPPIGPLASQLKFGRTSAP